MNNIKTDKNTRVLMLYHYLLKGYHINKDAFSNEHCIDKRTFDRDVEDIRLFLSEIYSGQDVQYDRNDNTYYLTGGKIPTYINKTEATVISKILLESSSLRKDEILGLVYTILNNVFSNDISEVENLIKNSISNYYSKTKISILKIIGDLYAVIDRGTDIEAYISKSGCVVKEKISPIDIEINKCCFYLVGASNLEYSNIIRYQIEDVISFIELKSKLAKSYQEKYFKERG